MQRVLLCVSLALLFAATCTGCFGIENGADCLPRTCEDMQADCGTTGDGCGNTLECGACSEGHECGVMEPNRCYCEPRTCSEALAACGEIDDGCGNAVTCGECGSVACGGGGTPNVCGIPEDEKLCRASGLCWENPLPLSLSGHAIAAASDDRAWAVGAGGTILEWNGRGWSLADSGTSVDLNDVWALSEDDAIAVGDAGTVLRFDGTSWSQDDTVGADAAFSAVHGTSADDIWIAGSTDAMRYFEGAWIPASSEAPPAIVDLWVGRTVWATGTEGRVYEHRNGRFEAIVGDEDMSFHGIWGRGGDEAYAVGSEDVSEVDLLDPTDPVFNPFDYRGIVLSLPSSELLAYEDPTGFWGVYGNDSQVLAVDYDHGRLVTLAGEPGPRGIPNQRGFVGAASATPARHFMLDAAGGIHRYEGLEWQSDATGVVSTVADLSATGDSVFLATQDGMLVRLNGGALALNVAVGKLTAIHAAAEDDVWAVGEESRVVHFDGREVKAMSGPTASYILEAVASVDGAVFVAGVGIHRRTAAGWTPEDVPADAHYLDLFALDGTVYAGGSRVIDAREASFEAVVLTLVGDTWQTQTVPGMDRVVALHGTAADDLFAAGVRVEPGSFGNEQLFAVIAHFDGTAWTTTELEDVYELHDIAAIGDGRAIAIGYGGVILQFEAGTWSEVDRIPGRTMNAVTATGSSYLVGGEAGAVLRKAL